MNNRVNLQIGYELQNLPNVHGFRFRGVTHDGDLIDCMVVQGDDDIHRIVTYPEQEAAYNLIRGWMQYLPKKLVSEGFMYETPHNGAYKSNFVYEKPDSPLQLNKREVFSVKNT